MLLDQTIEVDGCTFKLAKVLEQPNTGLVVIHQIIGDTYFPFTIPIAILNGLEERVELKKVVSGLRKKIREDHPGIGLQAIATAINEPLGCGHHVDCWNEELERCDFCAARQEAERRRDYFAMIGLLLDPIRQKRSTGEPSRSDREEIVALIKRAESACGSWTSCPDILEYEEE